MSGFEERLLSLLSFTEKEPGRVAHELALRYLTPERLAVADYTELVGTLGLSEKTARLLRLSVVLTSRARTEKFSFGKAHTEGEILDFLKGLYYGVPNETVYMLIFDGEMRVRSLEFIGDGTVNSSGVLPRKMLELLLADKKNKRAIIAHNHPGGFAKASVEDMDVTAKVASLFHTAGIELICHYVIAGNSHYKIDPNAQKY